MYALVDCNNFYVSCEKVFNPSLEGKPVIVLSNNDGCVISRSDEAKKAGFKMGEPVFKKKELVRNKNVVLFSSNYTLYGDMSQRVMDTLSMFSPFCEPYSIDECFLDLSYIDYGKLPEYGLKIRETVERNTGIPVGVGIGKTKSLAKIASRIAKQNKKGIYILNSHRQTDAALKNTLVQDIWGIGRQYARLLERNNILTAYDFINVNDHWIKKNMSVMGLRFKKELTGESCIPIETMIKQKKAIATTRAFGKKIESEHYLKEAVSTYATRCGEKLRKQKCVANIITVFIHTDPFNKNEKYINLSKTITIPVPANNQKQLVKYSLMILKEIYRPGIKYKKAGVIVDGLEPESSVQASLFDNMDLNKQRALTEITDLINKKFGRDKVRLSIQGDGKEWKLRQDKLSKKYTTRLSDIIDIIAG